MNFKILPKDKSEGTPSPLYVAPAPEPTPLTVVPPTSDSPVPKREFGLTIVSRHRATPYWAGRGESLPEIRFGGKYLEQFNFPIGTRLQITVKKGKITIEPHKDQPWLPADVARELAAGLSDQVHN